MTNKKRPSTKKMKDYENEKMEIAKELGTNDPYDTEVNTKIASQDEAVNSSKTITKRNNLHNFEKTKGRKDI
ncbi:hypothetical protein [Terrisporobacter sp.]|uniref:hypothetical protein n=1 Tax=Terrisporobacter sp. TaxID=1965305 RepID=UPI0026238C85|nr:hypothetical protein [Terrisporobacter sp.]